jgi:hypothetical protein
MDLVGDARRQEGKVDGACMDQDPKGGSSHVGTSPAAVAPKSKLLFSIWMPISIFVDQNLYFHSSSSIQMKAPKSFP